MEGPQFNLTNVAAEQFCCPSQSAAIRASTSDSMPSLGVAEQNFIHNLIMVCLLPPLPSPLLTPLRNISGEKILWDSSDIFPPFDTSGHVRCYYLFPLQNLQIL